MLNGSSNFFVFVTLMLICFLSAGNMTQAQEQQAIKTKKIVVIHGLTGDSAGWKSLQTADPLTHFGYFEKVFSS